MIPMWFVAALLGVSWTLLMFHLAYGRNWVHNPWWVLIGIPAPIVGLLAVGYFYYGLPLFDWGSFSVPVSVVNEGGN